MVSVGFQQVLIGPDGRPRWTSAGVEQAWPSDGWASVELGYLVEAPDQPVQQGETWVIRRAGQGPVRCQLLGVEPIDGISCFKLVSASQSQNWSGKEATSPAWSQQCTVWTDPKTGLARRVRREHQLRLPGQSGAPRVLLVEYDQASNRRYHGTLLQQHVADFQAAAKAQTELEQATHALDRQRRRHLSAAQHQLQFALSKPSATPYRPAMAELLRRVEQSQQGKRESIAPTPSSSARPGRTARAEGPVRARATVGRPAPSFVLHQLETNQTVTVKKLAGKPALIVLADPASELSQRAVKLAVSAAGRQPGRQIQIYVACTQSDPEALQRLRDQAPGPYVLCSGAGLDKAYGVEAAPHTLFIDADGVLRGNYPGLGPEHSASLTTALEHHTRPTAQLGSPAARTNTFRR